MKLLRWFGSVKRRFASLLSAFDRKDLPVAAFVIGLIFLGYGASQIHHGVGPIIVGALLVIYVRPLIKWVR